MQAIKVQNTKRHNDKQVVEAEVVLVQCEPSEGLIYLPKWKHEESKLRLLTRDVSLSDAVHTAYKPILISRTEKIEVGDWAYNSKTNELLQVKDTDGRVLAGMVWCKVLALPEHFSPEHLQMIVDGKLKNRDKVLIECEVTFEQEKSCRKCDCNFPSMHSRCDCSCHDIVEYSIKLNPHITLYSQEEKMYTREELMKYIQMYELSRFDWRGNEIKGIEIADKWFEENVK